MDEKLTAAQFIEKRIHQAFVELAEKLAANEPDEDKAAEIPSTVSFAEMILIDRWREIVATALEAAHD